VGKVANGNLDDPHVILRANLDRLEYVSVLFFDGPSRALIERFGKAQTDRFPRADQRQKRLSSDGGSAR
jgi:hypothetical protein